MEFANGPTARDSRQLEQRRRLAGRYARWIVRRFTRRMEPDTLALLAGHLRRFAGRDFLQRVLLSGSAARYSRRQENSRRGYLSKGSPPAKTGSRTGGCGRRFSKCFDTGNKSKNQDQ